MQLIDKVNILRIRICRFRLKNTPNNEISTHVNAVDIVLSLTELAIKDKRAIRPEEENWFRAGLYLSYVFSGSEWEDIVTSFDDIVNEVRKRNYFRSP